MNLVPDMEAQVISLHGSLLQIEGLATIPCLICSSLTNSQEEDTTVS